MAKVCHASFQKENIIQAIKDGVPASIIKDDLERVAKRQDELAALMESSDSEPRPLIHPTMSRRYKSEISALTKALSAGGCGSQRTGTRTDREDRSSPNFQRQSDLGQSIA